MTKKITKKSLKWPKVILLVAFTVLGLILAARQIPLERISYSGGCRSTDNRLSLILDGQGKVSRAREEVEKMNREREERQNKYPGLSDGCSPGLSYSVYIF